MGGVEIQVTDLCDLITVIYIIRVCHKNRRLCLVGVCAKCGGRLCINIGCSNELVGNDFLVETYRQLRQLYHLDWRRMPNQEFWERFEQLFHEQDRPALSEWREWLEERYGEEKV